MKYQVSLQKLLQDRCLGFSPSPQQAAGAQEKFTLKNIKKMLTTGGILVVSRNQRLKTCDMSTFPDGVKSSWI